MVVLELWDSEDGLVQVIPTKLLQQIHLHFLPLPLKEARRKQRNNALQSQRTQALTQLPNLTDSK